MEDATTSAVRIGDVVIDIGRRRIDREGSVVELPQRPFDLLCLFLNEPRTLHTRKDIFRRVWKGVVVEDANLSQSVWVVRRALGPQGKDWIRTVAKSGYVFDPPLPIETIADAAAETIEPVADVATPPADSSPPTEPAAAAPRRFSWPLFAAAALLLTLAIAWGQWRYAQSPEPLRVMLITVAAADGVAPSSPQWPAQLLREWLEWKLSREPNVVVVSASRQLAGNDERGRIVLLSVEDSPVGEGRLRMHAYLGDADRSDLTVDAVPAEIPQAADRISGAIVRQLVPDRAEQPFPPLELDADAAQDYIAAMQRRTARRPAEAVGLFEAVLKRAPRFGLARIQLAEALDELGQVGAAKQQLAFAEQWISQLPPVALRIQKAKAAMLARDYPAAAGAFAALAAEYPHQPRFRLAQARALTLVQRSADAQLTLDAIDWSSQPLPLRLDALLARAEAQRESGALDAAKKTAKQADELAAEAGWPLERGRALLIFANASANDDSLEKRVPFDRAAEQFKLAGDRMSMLRARLAGEALMPVKPDAEAEARLAALLGEARAAGNREIEVDAVRLEARRFRRAANFVRSRELLIEASALAQAAGDLQRDSALQRDLALVSMGMADYAAADRYLAELDAAKPQGSLRLMADQIEVRLSNRLGRYDRATEVARAVAARPVEASTITAAMIDCDYSYTLFVRGDLATARTAAERCMRSGLPYDTAAGNLLIARIALVSGDKAEALRRIEAALPSFERLPDVDRWDLGAVAYGLRARAGARDGAEAALLEILPHVVPGQMRFTESEVRLGLAELALARGDLAAADVQADALRKVLPADDWYAGSRLILIDAMRDARRGSLKQAMVSLLTLDRHAREIGDVAIELSAHSLAASMNDKLCPEARDRELIAKSGMRGLSSERWSLGDRTDQGGDAMLAAQRARTEPAEKR